MDIVDSQTRSRMMANIKSTGTKPERIIADLLMQRGFDLSADNASLPVNPDIIVSAHHAVIFIHGCFWHGHQCHLFKIPATRRDFWINKIQQTILRDKRSQIMLQQQGWRHAIVWECEVRKDKQSVGDKLAEWLLSEEGGIEI